MAMVKKKVVDLIEAEDAKTRRWKAKFSVARMTYADGKLREAESLLAAALELAHELPEHDMAVFVTEIGAAAVLLAQQRFPEGQKRLEKSIGNLRGYSDSSHKELLAVALRFHAEALSASGSERQAEKELEESAAILAALGPEASAQLAYTYSDLCGLYLTQGRYSEAENYITQAMKIAFKVLGPESPEYLRADMIYEVTRPMTEGTRLECVADGIQRMEYLYGAKHPNIARALDRYFHALRARGVSDETIQEASQRFGVKL